MADGSAPMPYTEADVERIARTALARSGWTMPLEEGMDLVRGVLAELAAAGRLLPEGASLLGRGVDFASEHIAAALGVTTDG